MLTPRNLESQANTSRVSEPTEPKSNCNPVIITVNIVVFSVCVLLYKDIDGERHKCFDREFCWSTLILSHRLLSLFFCPCLYWWSQLSSASLFHRKVLLRCSDGQIGQQMSLCGSIEFQPKCFSVSRSLASSITTQSRALPPVPLLLRLQMFSESSNLREQLGWNILRERVWFGLSVSIIGSFFNHSHQNWHDLSLRPPHFQSLTIILLPETAGFHFISLVASSCWSLPARMPSDPSKHFAYFHITSD